MEYKEEDFLLLSGLQHFMFCRRQWALIHIEDQWADNLRTIDGSLMHKNAHDKDFREKRGDCIITRGMRVFSHSLGVSGECDVLEFHRDDDAGIPLKGQAGRWKAYPVEYKKGDYNPRSGDSLQLCGQAMCLEEMLCCFITEGALFFGETRRRVIVQLTEELRQAVRTALIEMHDLYRRGHTPKAKITKSCNACSLKELCLPKLIGKRSVKNYLLESMGEQNEEST